MKNSLKSNGKLIIDVPNMDWFFAHHERYMDFTHECGFTKESLAQVVNMHFPNFSIFTADNIFLKGFLKMQGNILSEKVFKIILYGPILIADQ